MATNGNFAHQEQYKGSADTYTANPASIDPANNSGASNDLSKDEVGWYFVEQYYTTLSKSPEKLHLFYSKRSQFVSGVEAEVANVSVGRQAIQQRIKELDFQDCKVRVSNVDSQASFDSIVIQVIGEISSKTGEPKKFVQTFVLAQQPTGYFVLNDILRYIDDEAEEVTEGAAEVTADRPNADVTTTVPEEEQAEVETEATPAAEAPKEEPAPELDTKVVDEKLDEAATSKDEAATNGTPAAAAEPAKSEAAAADPETTAQELAEEDAKEPEKPKDPNPTPAATKPAPAQAAPAEPAAPPKPMTWASRAAAAAGPRPVVPLPKTATPPAQNQPRAPAPAAAAAAAAAAQPAAAAPPAEAAAKDISGWQTAGADSKRQNRPQSISAAPAEKEGTLGYVKYVTEKVQDADLKKALEAHGELAYFDINRQKNCAFVEYKTTEGYHAALNSNPHVVNGEQIIVEQRRPKSNAYGGSGYGGGRGGSQRGRGGFDGNRTGGQGTRGNFSGGNRGRGAPRGRGAAQVSNA